MEIEAMQILDKLHINIQNPRLQVAFLSGGQQQAVAIGKAVSFAPKMVIMDEPTANLASKEIGKVLELIGNLKDHPISVIIISHRLEDIFEVSDKILVLRHGKKVALKDTENTNKKEILHFNV